MNQAKRNAGQRLIRALPVALLLSTVGAMSHAQSLANHRCVKDSQVRLIEIRVSDSADRLPCEVVYRPGTEGDFVGKVSWRGLTDLSLCETRARDVADQLTGDGWSCAEEAADLDQMPRALLHPAAGPSVQTPEMLLEPQASKPVLDTNRPDRSTPNALAQVIEHDLVTLGNALDGILQAEIGEYGDLNADRIDDALVVYTYHSEQPAYRQFLAAYLSDGTDYHLTATRAVSGSTKNTRDAEIEQLDDGVIHLRLRAFQPGDEICCPTGTRKMALAFRDLDLVEVPIEDGDPSSP